MSIRVGSLELNEEQYEGVCRFDSNLYKLKEESYSKMPDIYKNIRGSLGYWFEHTGVVIEDLRIV